MEQLPETTGHFEQALHLQAIGFRLVAVRPGTKIPSCKGWQEKEYDEEDLYRLFEGTEANVGIITGGDLVVLDIDSTSAGDLDWVLEHVGETPMKVRSPRGGTHLYFRARRGVAYGNGVKLGGRPYDLRWQGCFITCPWSQTPDGRYEWLGEPVPAVELPFMKVSPLRPQRQRTRQQVQAQALSPDASFMEVRASRWLDRVEGAVSGQGGHSATFRVACKLVHYFGLGRLAAIRLMLIWNERCQPPWSIGEIEHKVDSAIKRGKAP
jgi:hypothetical protein